MVSEVTKNILEKTDLYNFTFEKEVDIKKLNWNTAKINAFLVDEK